MQDFLTAVAFWSRNIAGNDSLGMIFPSSYIMDMTVRFHRASNFVRMLKRLIYGWAKADYSSVISSCLSHVEPSETFSAEIEYLQVTGSG